MGVDTAVLSYRFFVMAKLRQIHTKFWSDSFVQSLNQETKLIYLYLLTNEHTNILGIYEITEKTISFESGCDLDSVQKAIDSLSKANKVHYFNNYIILTKFLKYQSLNPKVVKGIEREFAQLSEEIRKYIISTDSLCIAYDSLSHLNLNFNLNLSDRAEAQKNMYKEEIIQLDGDGEETTEPSKKKTFGQYPQLIATYYMELVGKRGDGRFHLVAGKQLMEVAQEDFPDDSLEELFKEIKGRIDVAAKYYKSQEIKEWNLAKVVDNWDKILKWHKKV